MSSTDTVAALASANLGFDHLFANHIADARTAFSSQQTPFHLLGLGVCAFLEAALGMEGGLAGEASLLLAQSEAGAKKAAAEARSRKGDNRGDGEGRFAAGLEWEILGADAVVLLGLTHALSESYMGYFQCMYSLNAAHSKFTRLYKTVFPDGLPGDTPSVAPSAASSSESLVRPEPVPASAKKTVLGRWGVSAVWSKVSPSSSSTSLSTSSLRSSASSMSLRSSAQSPNGRSLGAEASRPPEGPVEEMIVSGTAFGFGLFNLVFSLLPKKVQSLVGLFGFKHDRALALRALALSAGVDISAVGNGTAAGTGRDVHSVFAGLVLMTFYGVVLLLAGYQADEAETVRVYQSVVDSIEARYPTGALWILNRAKILRMTGDADGAIAVLQGALDVGPRTFVQADTLLVFELAWTLLAQRRHREAAEAFVKLTELNSWSHATYYFIAAGCYISLGERDKAQELFDALPTLLERKKMGGKDLPTEVLIRKRITYYQEKQRRRGGDPARYVESVKISTADELGIFWNTYQRIDDSVAEAHIKELVALTPPVAINVPSPHLPQKETPASGPLDLDTPDEIALRSLLLGLMHRTLCLYAPARALLEAAARAPLKASTWIAGVALFELAVAELREAAAANPPLGAEQWDEVLRGVEARLTAVQGLIGKNDVDLASRLESRVALLRDEVEKKRIIVQVGK